MDDDPMIKLKLIIIDLRANNRLVGYPTNHGSPDTDTGNNIWVKNII